MNVETRPLAGIRVLDLTVALSGPYATLLLGGLGAEVIHIEAPGGSDIARTNPPFVGPRGVRFDHMAEDEVSLSIVNRGRNKKSVTLDLKSEKGRALFFELAKHADVVVENMSEGTAARLGVAYEDARRHNPRIVYASINAMGDPSMYPGLKGMDIIVQALSGFMEVTGFADGPPLRAGIPMADMIAPLFAVSGLLAALIERGRTGEGQHVKVSMLDCLASMVAEEHFDVMLEHGYAMRSGNYHDRLAPFGVYPTKDGHVAIVAFQPAWMEGLMEAMGRSDLLQDPRFSGRGPRMRNATALNQIIEAWTKERTSDEVVSELRAKRSVPAAHVRKPQDVLHDPLLHASGAVVYLQHPALRDVRAAGMGMPIRFSRSKAEFDQPTTNIGAANDEILGGLLKLPPAAMAKLRAEGII
ncbi:MAG: CoA transferase [Burkholderiales bacterium]|nr:CoA transferase [Burkholderiales bacterium]